MHIDGNLLEPVLVSRNGDAAVCASQPQDAFERHVENTKQRGTKRNAVDVEPEEESEGHKENVEQRNRILDFSGFSQPAKVRRECFLGLE